jgi:hypothetical protein
MMLTDTTSCGPNTTIPNSSSGQNQLMSIYEFTKKTCTKLTGGESISAAAIARSHNEMAAGMIIGNWMIFLKVQSLMSSRFRFG